MVIKSDNQGDVGRHCFEQAGLGRAPFAFVGFHEAKYQAAPGAPVQAGANCAYCGTGIMYVCTVRSADGKEFGVGCDCVDKTGDAGIIQSYKTSREYRDMQAAKRRAKAAVVRQEIDAILADQSKRDLLAAFTYETGSNMLDSALRSLPWCGDSGRAKWLRAFRKVLNAA